ncbi:MAG: hypothetical protein P1V97_00820 [Planctomycetota bacterium]|nr:hypothetical protein [Planctomycetota bacterium]
MSLIDDLGSAESGGFAQMDGMLKDLLPLPFAGNRSHWAYRDLQNTPHKQGFELSFFANLAPDAADEEGKSLKARFPLLFHEFDSQNPMNRWLASFHGLDASPEKPWGPSPKATLKRLLPKLLGFRRHSDLGKQEFIFKSSRPSSLHILERVFEGGCPFWLEDLSSFATWGQFLVEILERLGSPGVLSPETILFAPALDASFPFRFILVDRSGMENRAAYVQILRRILKQSETDETFRDRHFKELMRGFQKFGRAAATPTFQTVERKIWRLLSHLAARLRVKAGRLTDCKDEDEIAGYLSELRNVNGVLSRLIHLPSRMAAFFRQNFQLELSKLAEHTEAAVKGMADDAACDLVDKETDLDALVKMTYKFQQLGVAAPRESLMLKDHDIKQSYTHEILDWPEEPNVRHYSDQIFTGARRFDQRRFRRASDTYGHLQVKEEDFDIELDSPFEFGQDSRDSGIHSGQFDITLDWEE